MHAMPEDRAVETQTPTIIIEPNMLFREGLKRIVIEAGFRPVWCSDRHPTTPFFEVAAGVGPLLIIGTEIADAFTHIREVKRIYPSCSVVLLLDPASQEQ